MSPDRTSKRRPVRPADHHIAAARRCALRGLGVRKLTCTQRDGGKRFIPRDTWLSFVTRCADFGPPDLCCKNPYIPCLRPHLFGQSLRYLRCRVLGLSPQLCPTFGQVLPDFWAVCFDSSRQAFGMNPEGPTLRSLAPCDNGPDWDVSALAVAAGPAFLSATRAPLRVLEPTAKGPETPFLSFLNNRAAGSPSGGREDALLEKSDAPRLRAKGQRPTRWRGSLFLQTWRPTLLARKH